ncbi:MAG: DUF3048 domain-containing protein, partial [Actinomycetota bacterium]|nr:DUF3048 domain-containing protein [Actinomycetota bacterium]
MNIPKALKIVIIAALVASACSGGDATTTTTPLTTLAPVDTTASTDTTAPPTTDGAATTTTAIPLPPSPLNGMGVEDEAALERRVIAVKIDNHWNARPQSGIEQADAVYELLVEGGLTRFIGLFHHSDSEYLGPIRSGRPTDPTLVAYLGAPLQISGAQPWVSSVIAGYGVKLLGDNGNTTFRIGARRAPHNLYGSTVLMREEADRRGYPDEPPAVPTFNFGDPTPGTPNATAITLDWSDRPEVRWEWTGTEYVRFNGDIPHNWLAPPSDDEDAEDDSTQTSTTEDGSAEETPEDLEHQIATDTIVVVTATKYWASSASGAGSSVPALDTVGSGDAYVFYGGVVVEGTWQRDSVDERFELTLEDGSPIVIPAGRLWISVFPNNQQVTW